ncbi:MAG TPA: fibronectin type III domain-containing protein [Polyangiaceae bacterium]|jgi:hypothetical protein
MTTNNSINSIHRATVSINIPPKIADLISLGHVIVTKLTNNPLLPTPTPSVSVILGALNDLQTAQTAANARTKGAATVRNEKRTVLISLLQQLRGYVQTTADATPENGASIIESSGLSVRKTPTRTAQAFGAKEGPLSGTAKVTAVAAGPRSSYEWQVSTDGAKTWVNAPTTIQAKTVITGLAAGTTVQFRYRPVTKTGEGDWSQPVALLVK